MLKGGPCRIAAFPRGPGPWVPQCGFSLVELLVGISILAFSLAVGIPYFGEWIRNVHIRGTAESMQSGLQFARAEAVRRNTPVRFQIVSDLTNGCTLSTTDLSWVVNLKSSVSPAGACATAVSDSTTPFVLQVSPAVTTSNTANVSATQSTVAFDGLGRVMPATNPTTTIGVLTVQVTSAQATCLGTTGGTARCLNVVLSPGGQVRLCDPSLANSTGTNGPVAC